MKTDKKLSPLINRFLPEYIRKEYQKFSKFIEYYLEYLEEDGKVYTLISDFLHWIDIDKLEEGDPYYRGDDEVLEQYINQYISSFPLYRIEDIDVKKLIKNAKDFYSAKGTERSYDFIFRLMNYFGSFSFYYPSEDILIISNLYDGQISSGKKIHDNNYRAYWTYEIRSNLYGFAELKDIVNELLHPIGTKVFFLREVEDRLYEYFYLYESVTSLMFVIYDLPIQWLESFSVKKIYLNESNYGLYDEFTFYEFEGYAPYAGILNSLYIDGFDDTWYNLENFQDNETWWPFQIAPALTIL